MKILIVGLNYAPEKVGIAVYTTGMAEALVARGHEVRVIAAQPYYPAWKIMDGHNAFTWSNRTENGVRVTRVPHYIPGRPTGARRLIHHATFALSALVPSLWTALTFRPDMVLTIAPSLIGAPVARLAAWVAGAQSWLHIQDFEVEAAFATGLIKGGRVARAARWFENTVLRSFERVSTISPAMCRKAVEKGVPSNRVIEFRNWADVQSIHPLGRPSRFRELWNITTEHVALYSGNIANKQGIDIVLDAARRLAHRKDLTFVVCGEGPNRANLEAAAADLDNIQFRPLQPRDQLNELLGLATVHLLPQIAGAADLVLPSKLTNMLAAGGAIVATAVQRTGLYDEVYGCGVLVPPEDADAFAGAIADLVDHPDRRASIGAKARNRALLRWTQDSILGEFHNQLVGTDAMSTIPNKSRPSHNTRVDGGNIEMP